MSLARTRIAVRLIAVAALAALTAGCFQPMYAERNDGKPGLREKLMGVEIPPVDKPNASREARIQVDIRNALAFKLYGNATGMPPTHRLVLRFTTSRNSLMIDPATALPSSENYGIDAQYNLIDLATNKSVMTGTTFSRLSYDIPGQLQRFARRRAIRVRAGSRSFASGVDTLADSPVKDCRIVIEAGELRAESPLRKACERAKTAVAIACYPDTERDLARLIDEELRSSNLRIAADACAVLMSLLGG